MKQHLGIRALQFAVTTFLLVLLADAAVSLVFGSAPASDHQARFWLSHGAFHVAVLLCSAAGAGLAFCLLRSRMPAPLATLVSAVAFGSLSAFAAPGMLILAGTGGALAWLLLGSFAFALGSSLARRPWQRPSL